MQICNALGNRQAESAAGRALCPLIGAAMETVEVPFPLIFGHADPIVEHRDPRGIRSTTDHYRYGTTGRCIAHRVVDQITQHDLQRAGIAVYHDPAGRLDAQVDVAIHGLFG